MPTDTLPDEPLAGPLDVTDYEVLWVPVGSLTHNPLNYRKHNEAHILTLRQSLREHGWQQVVIVDPVDHTLILDGHGRELAAQAEGLERMPVHIYHGTDPKKWIVTANESDRQAEVDDRALTELLKELKQSSETGLEATGFDEMMLANLLFTTRLESKIADFDAAAEWVGLPSMGEAEREVSWPLVVWCDSEADREQALALLGITSVQKKRRTLSTKFPVRDREPRQDSTLRFMEEDTEE